MKKFAIVLATTILLLSLTACSKDDSSSKDRSEESTDVVEETEETEEAEETETTETSIPTENNTFDPENITEVDLVFEDGQNVVYAEDLGFDYDELCNSSDKDFAVKINYDFDFDGETDVLNCLHPSNSDDYLFELGDVSVDSYDVNAEHGVPYAFVKSTTDGHVIIHTSVCGGNDLYLYETLRISDNSIILQQSFINTTTTSEILSSDINNLNMYYNVLPGATFEITYHLYDQTGLLYCEPGEPGWTPCDDNCAVRFAGNYSLDLIDENGPAGGPANGTYDVNEETIASFDTFVETYDETGTEVQYIYLNIDDNIVRIPYDYYDTSIGELYEDQGVQYTRLHLEGL